MSFSSPALLAALLVVPLAMLLVRRAGRRAPRHAIRFTGVATLAAVMAPEPRRRRLIPPALFLAALAALALALARPHTTVAVPVERASVVLVTDVSLSMIADDIQPSRLGAAARAGQRFLDQVPDELRVGSVTFSDKAQTVDSPSTDHDAARNVLDSLVADGGTATGDGLAAALDLLKGGQQRAPAAIVLLSDGESTLGIDPQEVAREAGRLEVPVYTVALGTTTEVIEAPDGSLIPVPPDPEALRDIARVSGGRAFEADEPAELDAVYERLGSQLGTREERREITAGFAGVGALALLLAAGTSLRWAGRLP